MDLFINTLHGGHYDIRLVTQEFVMGLSVLARGSLHEKLHWAFTLYDINGDGVITRHEMYDIVSAVYDMMGQFAVPPVDQQSVKNHVDRVFEVCC